MQNLSMSPLISSSNVAVSIDVDTDASLKWRLFPYFVVRTTGFPVEFIEHLQSSDVLLLTRRQLELQVQLQELRRTVPKQRRPERRVMANFKAGKPLPEDLEGEHDWVRNWNTIAIEREQLEQELQVRWVEETERLKTALLDSSLDPRVLEAIASTNPGVYQDIVRGKLNKRLERQLAAYLQRLCTKNETISFFGPINYGVCEAKSEPSTVHIEWRDPLSLRARRAHPASWLIRGLVDQIAFSPVVAPWLVLSRRTFARTDSIRNPLLLRLVHLVDNITPLSSLSKTMGISIEEATSLAFNACRTRFVSHQLEVPAACESPLEDLMQRLAGLPGRVAIQHLENIEKIMSFVSRFSEADAAGKVQICDELRGLMATTYGIEAPSSAPQFYGDRQPVREECVGTLQIKLSGSRASELESLVQPSLALLTGTAVRTQKAANRAVAALLGTCKISLLQALIACTDHKIPFDTQLVDAMTACIPDSTVHEVHLEHLALPEMYDECSTGAVCSVDLMIGAESPDAWAHGDYEIVLSDIHDTALVWGWALQFHQSRERVQAELVARLAQLGDHLPVINCLASRRTGLPPAEFPGPVVEIGGMSATAHPWLLPVDDLWVESNGESARLCSQSLNSEVMLWNGELESLFHTAFALPRIRPVGLSLGIHTPRLVYHGVIVQREQWQLDTTLFTNLFKASSLEEKMTEALKIWDFYHLPQRLFSKFPMERKPMYIDLASPHLLAAAFDARKQENPYVVFSEMRPGPGQFWLHSPMGHHTAELRCTFIHERRRVEIHSDPSL
jgi:hypothetical protein